MFEKVMKLSLDTVGIVKFDLKAYTSTIYKALTGEDNKSLWIILLYVRKK